MILYRCYLLRCIKDVNIYGLSFKDLKTNLNMGAAEAHDDENSRKLNEVQILAELRTRRSFRFASLNAKLASMLEASKTKLSSSILDASVIELK